MQSDSLADSGASERCPRVAASSSAAAANAYAVYAPTPRSAATPNWTKSTDLDDGDPAQLGREYRVLHAWLPNLTIVVGGGCCGTDHRHVEAICEAMTAGK